MTILKTSKYIKIAADDGKFLYDGNGEILEGCMCPTYLNPSEIYTEVAKEEAISLIEEFRKQNNITDGQDLLELFGTKI